MAHAQSTVTCQPGDKFCALAPIPGLTDQPTINTIFGTAGGNFAVFFNNLYLFCIGLAVILAIGMIIWGGFEYALSEAITSKTAGRQRIQHALFGLLLVLSPALVFYIINPAILNLNVNFPPLDTKTGTYVPPPPGIQSNSENRCNGTDCSGVAAECNGRPDTVAIYQCVGPSGNIRTSPDGKPMTCQAGEQNYVACSAVGPTGGGDFGT